MTLEIDTLGFVPLHLGPGYGDAEWAHGQWKGAGWAEAVRRRPHRSRGRAAHPVRQHRPRRPRGLRRRRGLGPVRARQHRRARADRLRRPDVGRAVSVVVRSDVSPTASSWSSSTIPSATTRSPPRWSASCATAFADLRDDRDVRAVVVAGRGQGLLRGRQHDRRRRRRRPRPRTAVRSGAIQLIQEHLAELMLAIHELPAAGHRRGARRRGRRRARLALACDLRVASDDAFFAAQFIRVGLSSCDVGTSYWLPRVVGPTIAAELMLTGRRFSRRRGRCASACSTASCRATSCSTRAVELRRADHRQQRVRRVHDQARHVGQPRRAEPAARDGAREPHPGAGHVHRQHDRSRPRPSSRSATPPGTRCSAPIPVR